MLKKIQVILSHGFIFLKNRISKQSTIMHFSWVFPRAAVPNFSQKAVTLISSAVCSSLTCVKLINIFTAMYNFSEFPACGLMISSLPMFPKRQGDPGLVLSLAPKFSWITHLRSSRFRTWLLYFSPQSSTMY